MQKLSQDYWKNKYSSLVEFGKLEKSTILGDTGWFRETFSELEYLRATGWALIKDLGLETAQVTPSMLMDFWDDYYRFDHPLQNDDHTVQAEKFIDANREEMEELYPPSVVNTINYWYYVWINLHVRHNAPVEEEDYQILFTLLQLDRSPLVRGKDEYTRPHVNWFWCMKLWATRENRRIKKLLLSKLLSDSKVLDKCSQGDFSIPEGMYPLESRDLFDAYCRKVEASNKREVERELGTGTRRSRIFREVEKLVKEGASIDEAFKEVEAKQPALREKLREIRRDGIYISG